MKKNIFSLGVLAAAAIALAGCAKTETNVPEVKGTGIPFEFTATSVLTKTTNDEEATNWEAGDKVNLFHAYLGGTAMTYVNDGAFTAAEAGAEVKFTGELGEALDPDGTYNWYALYPYTSQVTTPANHESGYVYIGSRSDRTQTQKGNSSMGHIAGSNYPAAGVANKIPGEEKPEIKMTHLSALLEIEVVNKTAEPITVTDISFTGTEDIVGSYFVDFASSPITFTPSNTSYVSNTARLTVEDGSAIAADGHAYFYLAVKPFIASASTDAAASTLSIKVTTAEHGTMEIEKVLEESVEFVGGTINYLKFNYTKADDITYNEISSLEDLSAQTAVIVNGQVTALSTRGFVVTDDTGSVFVYSNQDESSNYQIGQNVTVSGSIGFYNKCIQIASPSVTEGPTGSYSYPDPEQFGVEEVAAYNADGANRLATYITYTGKLVKGSSYWNLLVGSGVTTANATLYYQTLDMSGFNDGDWVTVTGYAMSVMSGRCAVIPTDIQLKVVPTLTYDSISDVPAAGISNGLIPVTITNAEGWSVSTTFDGEVVTEASISNEEITYTVSKNTTPLRRSGAIGVWFSKSGEETVTFSIPINQEAAEVEGTATLVLDGEGLAQLAGGNNYGEVKTGTIDGFTWESTGYRTSTLQNMLQLRKRDQNDDVSYIKLPTFPGNILQVVMKVTRTNSSAYSTSEADESTSVFAVQSGTTQDETVLVTATAGGGTVTLDLSEKNVKTGYIVLNDGTFGARVWEISVLYNKE